MTDVRPLGSEAVNFQPPIMKVVRQFILYGLIGLVAMGIDFALTYSLTEYLGWYYLLSVVVAFIIASMVNFVLQKKFTFRCTEKNIVKQYLLFAVIGVFGMLINVVTVFVSVEYFQLWYMYGKVIATFIAFFWNFGANKFLTFRLA